MNSDFHLPKKKKRNAYFTLVYIPFPPKLRLQWELRAHRTNQPPPSHHLTREQSEEKSIKALLSLQGTRQKVREPMGMRKVRSCASHAYVFQGFSHTQILPLKWLRWSIANKIKQVLFFYDVLCGLYCDLYTPPHASCGRKTFAAEY